MEAQAILSKNGKHESLIVNGKVEIKKFEAGKWNYVVMSTQNKYVAKVDRVEGFTPRHEVYCSKHRTKYAAYESMNKSISDREDYLAKHPDTEDCYQSVCQVLKVARV